MVVVVVIVAVVVVVVGLTLTARYENISRRHKKTNPGKQNANTNILRKEKKRYAKNKESEEEQSKGECK